MTKFRKKGEYYRIEHNWKPTETISTPKFVIRNPSSENPFLVSRGPAPLKIISTQLSTIEAQLNHLNLPITYGMEVTEAAKTLQGKILFWKTQWKWSRNVGLPSNDSHNITKSVQVQPVKMTHSGTKIDRGRGLEELCKYFTDSLCAKLNFFFGPSSPRARGSTSSIRFLN